MLSLSEPRCGFRLMAVATFGAAFLALTARLGRRSSPGALYPPRLTRRQAAGTAGGRWLQREARSSSPNALEADIRRRGLHACFGRRSKHSLARPRNREFRFRAVLQRAIVPKSSDPCA
jgi:hypothetical protein